ncbi:MAG: rpoE [Ilumatobacteraceae bacterium]|nr:rpoE [Ilumatobacteraceae bacterium]
MSIAGERGAEYLFRRYAGEVLGTLVRRFGDLDVAEDALQEALVEALVRWPREGEPRNPAAWLVSVARSKAIDRLRRSQRRPDKEAAAFRREPVQADDIDELAAALDDHQVPDDQLALMLLCCHPALHHDAQVALTLRTVAGLATDEIARGFMVDVSTMYQRLVRAKQKIRLAGIPFGVPDHERLAERIDPVLQVIYLVFNEGYASARDEYIRHELCGEAIRLARTLNGLVPDEPEVMGLLAMMLLHDARAPGRLDDDGVLITLERQDRSRWRRGQIEEGTALVDRALTLRRRGRYQIEAAIAALHSSAPTAEATDWPQIDALYGALLRYVPTPVVALNRAVARGMAAGPEAGLTMIDELIGDDALDRFHLLHATRGELLARAGRAAEARAELAIAVTLAPSSSERQFLERRLTQLG